MASSDPLLMLMSLRLKALGHPARLSILRWVVQGPKKGMPVGDIQTRLGIPGSTLSHHISELASAGLLRATRQGTTIRYAACFETLKELTDYVWDNCCGAGRCDPDCR